MDAKTYKIQELTVAEPDQKRLSVRLTIAESAEVEQSQESVVATVLIPREGLSLENVQLTALDRIREVIEQARQLVRATSSKIERNEF